MKKILYSVVLTFAFLAAGNFVFAKDALKAETPSGAEPCLDCEEEYSAPENPCAPCGPAPCMPCVPACAPCVPCVPSCSPCDSCCGYVTVKKHCHRRYRYRCWSTCQPSWCTPACSPCLTSDCGSCYGYTRSYCGKRHFRAYRGWSYGGYGGGYSCCN